MNILARKYWVALMPLLFGAVLATAAPVGRLAVLQYINGTVSIQPHGKGSWVAASANDPLRATDIVWTDKASRAELNVGTGLMQLNAETSLTIVNVSRHTVQVRLHQGTLYLHVHHLFDGEIYEVDSDHGAFTVLKSGDYRVDADPAADTTTITVWKGEGSVTAEHSALRVKGHEQVRISGTAAAYERHKDPVPDSFDEWCHVRNQRQNSAYPRVAPYPYPYAYPYPYPYPPGVVVFGRRGPWY